MLISELRNPNADVRYQASRRLVEIGEPAVVPLIQALADQLDDTRLNAAMTLLYLGSMAAPAVPSLSTLATDDPNAAVRAAAAAALGELGPSAKAAVPVLVRATGDENLLVRVGAAESLLKLTYDRSRLNHAEIRELEGQFRGASAPAYALQVIRDRGTAVLPSIVELLGSDDKDVRFWAAWTMEKLRKKNLPYIFHLLRVLVAQSEFNMTRMLAIQAIEGIGPDAKDAIPALKRAQSDKDTTVGAAAAKALSRIEPP